MPSVSARSGRIIPKPDGRRFPSSFSSRQQLPPSQIAILLPFSPFLLLTAHTLSPFQDPDGKGEEDVLSPQFMYPKLFPPFFSSSRSSFGRMPRKHFCFLLSPIFYFRGPCSSVQRRRRARRIVQQRIRNVSRLSPNKVMGNQNVKGGPSAPARVGGGKQSTAAAAGIEDAPSRTTWTAGEARAI